MKISDILKQNNVQQKFMLAKTSFNSKNFNEYTVVASKDLKYAQINYLRLNISSPIYKEIEIISK